MATTTPNMIGMNVNKKMNTRAQDENPTSGEPIQSEYGIYDAEGKPIDMNPRKSLFDSIPIPAYQSAYDPKTMSMMDYVKSIAGQYTQGYDAFKGEALNKGPSAWLNMAQGKNRLDEQGSREAAQREANASTAGSLDKLAMQGGLSSGARERAVEGGSKNYLGMSQDIARSADVADLGLQMQDQTNKTQMLQALPGMEQGRMENWEKAKSADVTNQLTETDRLNKYNMDIYSKKMEAAAAERQAQATASSGKK